MRLGQGTEISAANKTYLAIFLYKSLSICIGGICEGGGSLLPPPPSENMRGPTPEWKYDGSTPLDFYKVNYSEGFWPGKGHLKIIFRASHDSISLPTIFNPETALEYMVNMDPETMKNWTLKARIALAFHFTF